MMTEQVSDIFVPIVNSNYNEGYYYSIMNDKIVKGKKFSDLDMIILDKNEQILHNSSFNSFIRSIDHIYYESYIGSYLKPTFIDFNHNINDKMFDSSTLVITDNNTTALNLKSNRGIGPIISINKLARELFDYKCLLDLNYNNKNIVDIWYDGFGLNAIKSCYNMRTCLTDIVNKDLKPKLDILTRNSLKYSNCIYKSLTYNIDDGMNQKFVHYNNVHVYDIVPWAMHFFLGVNTFKSDGTCNFTRTACLKALNNVSNIASRIYYSFGDGFITLINGYLYMDQSEYRYIADEFVISHVYSNLIIKTSNNSRIGLIEVNGNKHVEIVGLNNIAESCEYYKKIIIEYFKYSDINRPTFESLHREVWNSLMHYKYNGCLITSFNYKMIDINEKVKRRSKYIWMMVDDNKSKYKYIIDENNLKSSIYTPAAKTPCEKWYKNNIMNILKVTC